MMYLSFNYDSKDIAAALAECAGEEENEKVLADLDYAVFQIQATAQNEYNSEFWRTFYKTLTKICDNVDRGLVCM